MPVNMSGESLSENSPALGMPPNPWRKPLAVLTTENFSQATFGSNTSVAIALVRRVRFEGGVEVNVCDDLSVDYHKSCRHQGDRARCR